MSGKYQAYPEYKDSGVEWLGQIPSHWTQCGFKRFALIRNGRDHKEVEAPDGNYPVIGSGGGFSHANQYLYDGESVLLGRKGTINKPLYIKGKFWTVDTMFYTEVQKNADARFLYYMALTFPFDYYSTNTALPSMTQGDLANHGVAAPSIEEQRTIAAFLDHETARIDRLIEKQQRLIELLKEKRQAVISHAVTKGLDPNVPMKDSGVEWLGQVPEHWFSCKLGRYARFIDGDRGSEYPNENDLIDAGVPFLSSKNIVNGELDLTEVKFISEEKFQALNRGKALDADLIVKVRGSVGRIGELAKYEVIKHGYITAFINAQMMIIRTTAGLNTDYLRLVSRSLYWTEQLAVGAYGTAQQQLSNEVFSTLCIALPPSEEQALIVNRTESEVARFDRLIDKSRVAISLMQERRTALISAAVTGKIDVRNWQPNTSTQSDEPDLPMAAEQAGRYHV